MKNELISNIDQAFLQLEFTMKLLTYIELGKIDKDVFDTHISITGWERPFSYPANAFNTYNDLILAAENCVLLSVGCTALVLETSLELVGKNPDPNNRSPEGMLRNLIHMIRCAFAHDMMYPKWEVRGDYAQPLEIQLERDILKLDLSNKHNQPFNIEDIGGYENYYEIKDLICKMI